MNRCIHTGIYWSYHLCKFYKVSYNWPKTWWNNATPSACLFDIRRRRNISIALLYSSHYHLLRFLVAGHQWFLALHQWCWGRGCGWVNVSILVSRYIRELEWSLNILVHLRIKLISVFLFSLNIWYRFIQTKKLLRSFHIHNGTKWLMHNKSRSWWTTMWLLRSLISYKIGECPLITRYGPR